MIDEKVCPKCGVDILCLPVGDKMVWFHKPGLIPVSCDFPDGVVISLKVNEPLLSDRFQELVKDAENSVASPFKEVPVKEDCKGSGTFFDPFCENLDLIKKRLAIGEISIREFLEMKECLK